jgi:hypothetical protein
LDSEGGKQTLATPEANDCGEDKVVVRAMLDNSNRCSAAFLSTSRQVFGYIQSLGSHMSGFQNKLAALLLVGVAIQPTQPARAQDTGADSWTERKCILYTTASNHFFGQGTPEGVSERFMSEHAAFLASGCLDRGHVCPRSQRELEIADTLSLMAVAEGMAGSFLPFNCAD